MFEIILQSIIAFVKANVPEIKHLALGKGGVDTITTGVAINRPALYIDIKPLTTNSLTNKQQAFTGQVELTLVIDVLGSLDSGSTTLGANLKHIGLIDKLSNQLSGLTFYSAQGEANGYIFAVDSFFRRRVSGITKRGNLADVSLLYDFVLTDYSNPTVILFEDFAEINVETVIENG